MPQSLLVSDMKLAVAMGAVLRAARLKRKLTAQQLGDRIGCTPEFIYRCEGGRKAPTMKTLRGLARGLETEAWNLLRNAERRLETAKEDGDAGCA